jgi:hypothetical protein
MSNYTFEDYKKAIKAKYEEEIEGEYSNNLSSPTPANLRKLCIKRFKSNNSKDDLITFESFFDFPFDKDKKNLFGDDEMNKLEAVKRFFLGKTENPAEDTIQLAAILVDLRPRPFREFRKQIDEEDLEIINELKNTDVLNEKVSPENLISHLDAQSSTGSEPTFVAEEPESFQNQESEPTQVPMSISTFVNIDEKPKSKKTEYLIFIAVFTVLSIFIYLAFPKKDCMQWSGDHYEEVTCDLEVQGIGTYIPVEPLDERIINLRKIQACDTTTFFKNGEAVIWYAKVGDSVDFFNTHGRHPENNKPLKPVTQYIIDKYVKYKK